MADLRISDLVTASQLKDDDYYEIAQAESGTRVSYRTTLLAIAVQIATMVDFTSDLNTTSKKITGAINELKQLISLIPQFSIEVVQVLPTEDISDTTIYLVPAEDPEVGNYYEEYIHVNNTWELVGTTSVDLSAYYTKLEVDGLLADKLEADDFEASQTTSANPITLETKQAGLAKSCVVEMTPIQSGTGDPSPTNIRPISGRTEASVTRTAGEDVETHTKEFGQTVYGGSLDLNSGVLTNEWVFAEYDGSEDWAKAASSLYDVFYLELADEGTGLVDDIRSNSTDISIYNFAKMVEKAPCISIRTNVTPNRLHIAIPNATTVAECKAYLAEHNLQVCYKKATPTTIQLSPEALKLLKGQNVISTDGDKVQVEFSDIPVGDYSVLLDYVKSLEDRIKALEG